MTQPGTENAASVNYAQKAGVSEGVFKHLLERHERELCDDCSQPRTSRVHTHRKTKGHHAWRPPLAAGDDVALHLAYLEMSPEEAQAHWDIATRGYAPGAAMGMIAFLSLVRHAVKHEFKLLGGPEAERAYAEGRRGGYQFVITDKTTGEQSTGVMCVTESRTRRSASQRCEVCKRRAHQYLCDHPTDAVCTKCNGTSELPGGLCTARVCRHCLGTRKEPCSKRLCKGCTRTNGLKESDVNRVDYCDEHAAAHGYKPPVKAAPESRQKRESRGQASQPVAASATVREFKDVVWTKSPYEFWCDRFPCETVIRKGDRALFDKKRSEAFCAKCGEAVIAEMKKSLSPSA
jgi:hypothetical protein